MAGSAVAEDAFLGPGFLLITAGAADRRIKAVLVERLLQRLGAHDVHMHLAAMVNWVDPARQAFGIGVHYQIEPEFCRAAIAEIEHGAEIPAGGDMQAGEGQLAGREGLHGNMQDDGTVLANRIEQNGVTEARRCLPQDPDRFGFQLAHTRRKQNTPLTTSGTSK